MTGTKPTRTVRRGRIFPEIQWTPEQKAQRQAEREALYQQALPIFNKVKPELMQSHYNWYITIEPNSGEYFLDRDEIQGALKAHEKYPNCKFHTFRINETPVCGTI
ncbi:hypothetical protein [Scytonema sp. NUACC26]|uniref:hypothetical protein n=1 Tax=Scytonema sp. NUACC26 TaxID=3140176 RepID=UPI0034DC9EF8